MDRVFIIAEAGINHNGSVKIAKALIEAAAGAGCDAVKFQTFKTENIVTKNASKAKYQLENTGTSESQFQMLKKLELAPSDYEELFSFCDNKKIAFMSTPFDEESVDFLDGLGMEVFKIPSGEITNKYLIQKIAEKKKPVVLSTGMSYLEEVKKAVEWIGGVWKNLENKPQLTLLHCVSEYPVKMENVNLLAIKTLESTFGLPVGYSDHTIGIEMPVAAVSIGAKIIEKHFTLDKNMEGPDHKASLEPDELAAMVTAIRNIEKAMGDGLKRPTENELATRKVVRKSLVAARDIKAGEVIKESDILIKRPGDGLPPDMFEQIVNKKAGVDISKDSLFKKSHFR